MKPAFLLVQLVLAQLDPSAYRKTEPENVLINEDWYNVRPIISKPLMKLFKERHDPIAHKFAEYLQLHHTDE